MSKSEIPKKSLVELGEDLTNFDLVVVEDKKPKANTGYLDEYLGELERFVKDSIANDLDVDSVEAKIKEQKQTFKGFGEFRKAFTAPLNGITKEFTSRESDWKSEISKLEQHKEKILEQTYLVAEKAIRHLLLMFQKDNLDLNINMSTFDSFIQVQRKVKGMLPNDKGNLSKASMTKIEKSFNEVAEPIRERIETEKQKDLQQKQFESHLPSVSSDNIAELKASLISLAKLKEKVPSLYPLVADSCLRTVQNKIEIANANILAMENFHKQEEAKREMAELKNQDQPLIEEIEKIEAELTLNKEDEAWLNEKLNRLRVIWKSFKFSENRSLAEGLSSTLNTRISELQVFQPMFDKEITAPEPISEEPPEKKVWKLKDADAVAFDITMLAVQVDTEEEAIEALVDAFRKSLIENGVE